VGEDPASPIGYAGTSWAGRYRRDFGCLILDFEWKSQPAAAEAILQHQKFKIQNSKF
jgi:hypothetical protein